MIKTRHPKYKDAKAPYIAPKGLVMYYFDYLTDDIDHPVSDHKLILILKLGEYAVADVTLEFKAAPTGNPHEDKRDYCQISAGLTERGAGLVDVTTAFKAINIVLQTVDCRSYESVVAEYVTRGINAPYSHGYITIDPSLYNVL